MRTGVSPDQPIKDIVRVVPVSASMGGNFGGHGYIRVVSRHARLDSKIITRQGASLQGMVLDLPTLPIQYRWEIVEDDIGATCLAIVEDNSYEN